MSSTGLTVNRLIYDTLFTIDLQNNVAPWMVEDDYTVESTADMGQLLLELQQVVADEVPLLTIGFADSLQVCNTARYDGWLSGKGANVVNLYSFLPA